MSLLAGENILATGRFEGVAGALRLFVPEVRSRETAVLLLETGGEAIRRPLPLTPQRKWSVFVIHHSHLDIGYTDLQGAVLRHHLAYLDAAVKFCEQSSCWPEPAQFRWNVESLLPLQRWLAIRPATARDELVGFVRGGRIEVCALPFGTHTEALSLDELGRQLHAADDLRERYGFPIVTAMQTDVPGAVLGLPGVLADAGIRNFAVAHNYAGRATPYLTGGLELPRLFYWSSPGGKRVLVWQTDSPHGVAYLEGNLLGLAESFAEAGELLPEYLAALASRAYPYGQSCEALGLPGEPELNRLPYPHDLLHLRVQGLLADNAPPSIVPAEVVRAWNERWTYPQLRLATNAEFFAEAQARLGDRLPVFSGDWTDWWADGLGSNARALAFNRRAQAELRTAQTLNVIADAVAGADASWHRDADRAYDAMSLFDEHTWGAAHPGGDALDGRESGALQWQSKAALAVDALERAADLTESAVGRLARFVPAVGDSCAAVLVVNTASVARSDVVRLFAPTSRLSPGGGLALRDVADGALLPTAVEPGPPGRNRPQGCLVSFLAHDVPPLGYRRYDLVTASSLGSQPEGEPSLENEHYSVEYDLAAGCVRRLFDRELGVDLVDASSPFGFGQYVYDRYTGSLSGTLRQNALGSRPAGSVGRGTTAFVESRVTAGFGSLVDCAVTPVEQRLTVRLAAPGAHRLETTLRLVAGVRRVELEYRLDRQASSAKESVYFAFPFALDDPELLLELGGGVGRSDERLPGSAAHLHVVRHWAALGSDRLAVALGTLEAPLLQVGNIYLPYPPYEPTVENRPGTLVAWAMNNVWDTNFVLSQAGEVAFRFAVSSARADPLGLGANVGEALSRPLVGILGAPRARETFTSPTGSFCLVDHAAVEVVTLAASRRGHDFIILLHSRAVVDVEARVEFPALRVERVWEGTFLERDLVDVTEGRGARIRLRPGDFRALAVDLGR